MKHTEPVERNPQAVPTTTAPLLVLARWSGLRMKRSQDADIKGRYRKLCSVPPTRHERAPVHLTRPVHPFARRWWQFLHFVRKLFIRTEKLGPVLKEEHAFPSGGRKAEGSQCSTQAQKSRIYFPDQSASITAQFVKIMSFASAAFLLATRNPQAGQG